MDHPSTREYEVRRRRPSADAAADDTRTAVDASPDAQGQIESLQRSVGNQSVSRMVRSGAVQRAPLRAERAIRAQVQRQGKAKPPAPLNEAQAVAELTQHWGVGKVGAGSQAEQEQMMRTLSADYFQNTAVPPNLGDLLTSAGWTAWKPPPSSPVWNELVKAFESLAKVFGGAPPVKEIVFFKTDYVYDPNAPGGPTLAPSNKELAHFSAGSYVVYEAATYQGTLMPLATGKSTPGAAAPIGSRPLGFTLVHELGHGIVEAAMSAVTPDTVKDYAAAVGWFGGKLYDMGANDVKNALKVPQKPDAQYEVDASNWKDAKWKEQPVSEYSLAGPSEDLPEAIAAYVRDPKMLQDRSPLRYAFIVKLVSSIQKLGTASPLKSRTP
jgi:hypothetical protein